MEFKLYKQHIQLLTIIFAVLSCVITGFILTNSKGSLNLHVIFCLFFINIVLLYFIGLFIFNKIKRVFQAQYQKHSRSRFHKQIIVLFSCISLTPAVCVLVFAVLFFNTGVNNLFEAPVRNSMETAGEVASIYIDSTKAAIENFAAIVGDRVLACVSGYIVDSEKIDEILSEETSQLKIDAIVMKVLNNRKLIIAKSPFAFTLQHEPIPDNLLLLCDGGILSWESGNSIIVAGVVNRDLGIYLMASTVINETILKHREKIKVAIKEYTNLSIQSSGLKLTFLTFFSMLSLLLLLASVFTGLIFANWIIKPIRKLTIAVKNIKSGNYEAIIESKKFNNEWDMLISTFNEMATKLENQKQQLIISQKQSAWRDIARKIAHEIKNPLTPIQLSAERLKTRYRSEIQTSPEIFESCINTIIRQVSCIGNLIKEFSDFARMPEPQPELSDIISLLKESIFSYAAAHKNIAFHQSYDREKHICCFDQSQMNQVIINVLQNGVNAILENNSQRVGRFIGNIALTFFVEGDTIGIIIEDDGPGFSETSIKKATEPYYTTRKSGSGLGLAIVYKIVSDHNGSIKFGKSQSLSGAKVEVYIPCI
ncbi:MAG: HAMP domain-containing protein [Holosporales bacterium]|jgi:two-component system nitrogen regulation sensor histidine kinase NtrY|nr:HAMP domain-containing protein [Holosporales bacterium]